MGWCESGTGQGQTRDAKEPQEEIDQWVDGTPGPLDQRAGLRTVARTDQPGAMQLFGGTTM